MKTYKNEKLNIEIKNADYFEIKELPDRVCLSVDGSLKFVVYDSSKVEAYDSSTVEAYDSSTVYAYGSSTVYAYDSSKVEAYASSTVYAYGSSTVYAYGSSKVEAYGSSTVEAYSFSAIFKSSKDARIKTKNHFGAVINRVHKTKKKTIVYKQLADNRIARLQLDKGQVFQGSFMGKCRTGKAKVLGISSIDMKKRYKEGYSQHSKSFVYRVGDTVSALYDREIRECSTGIHFFLTREEAVDY